MLPSSLQVAVEGSDGRTLVFARDVAAADEVADFLTEALHGGGGDRRVLAYHRGVPAEAREAALDTLARWAAAPSRV